MKITINNETITCLAGSTFEWTADDTLDSAVIQFISEDSQPLKPFTLVKYQFEDKSGDTVYDSGYMFSAADNAELYVKAVYNKTFSARKYKHTVTLVELTKIAEKFDIPALSLTTVDIGLAEQLNRAVKNINTVIMGYSTGSATINRYYFKISDRLSARLANQAGEMFVFSKSKSREIFDEILSAVGCRVVISEVTDDKGLVLDYIDLNDITDVDEDLSERNDVASNNNADDYAGRIYSEVSNATPQNLMHIVDSFKAKYGTVSATSADGILQLPYPIEYATQFSCCFNKPIIVNVTYETGTQAGTGSAPITTTIPSTFYFDAMNSVYNGTTEDYFVDKEYYDTITDDEERKKYIYYERGSEEVDISRTYKILFFTKTEFNTFAQNIVARYVLEHFDEVVQQPEIGQYTSENFSVYSTFSYDETVFDMYYAPLIDCVVDIPKNIDNKEDRDLSVSDNQSASVIDLDRYGRNLLGKIQRTGNNELFIDVEVNIYTKILPILSRLTLEEKKYVISKVNFQALTNNDTASETADSNYYRVRYYLTENYNNLSEKIGLSKQKEIYQIPLEGYKTIIPVKKHIEIADYRGAILETPTDNIASIFAQTLTSDGSGNKRAENCQLRTVKNTRTLAEFTLPVCAWGTANTLNFMAKFYDNYSAGLSIDKNYSAFKWIGGKKVAYNPYTGEDGELTVIRYAKLGRFTNARTVAGIQMQPRKSDEDYTAYSNNDIYWHKDRAESLVLQFIYDIGKKSDEYSESIIIGNPLITRNLLLSDTEELFVYHSGSDVKPTDTMRPTDSVLLGKASTYLQVVYSTTEDNKQAAVLMPTQTSGIENPVVCDSNGLIYFAYNGTMNYDGFYADGIAFYETD